MSELLKKLRYEALDSLRGICACMVVVYHFKPNSHLVNWPLIRHSYLFVDFFFVLSGFVIFQTYRDKLKGGFGLGRFVMLRIGRLYPLHAFILLCFVGYQLALWFGLSRYSSDLAFSGSNSLWALFDNFLLLNCFGLLGGTSWNYPAWSIGAEFWAYILFAVVVIRTPSRRLRVALCALGIVGLLCCLWISNFGTTTADANGFPRCLFGFAVGALLSCSRLRLPIEGWLSSAAEVTIVFLTILFVSAASGPVSVAAAPLVFVVAVTLFSEEKGIISRVLLAPSLRRLGELSYSIYMVHVLVILVCANVFAVGEKVIRFNLRTDVVIDGNHYRGIGLFPWQGDLAYLVQVALVITAATWTFHFIEKPWRDYSRRLVANYRTTKPYSGRSAESTY